jgi:hypothetical protein
MLSRYCFTLFLGFATTQEIFIDNVPGYAELNSRCAQNPLSTVVRDMESGCGDGGHTTSYSCFCTTSSSYMANVISQAVLSQCPNATTDANSATVVFHDYCLLGVTLTSTVATTTSTSILPTRTGTDTPSNNNEGEISRSTKILIGVLIPVGCVIAGIVGFIFLRLYQKRHKSASQEVAQKDAKSSDTTDDKFLAPFVSETPVSEMPGDSILAAEMVADNKHVTEMPA